MLVLVEITYFFDFYFIELTFALKLEKLILEEDSVYASISYFMRQDLHGSKRE